MGQSGKNLDLKFDNVEFTKNVDSFFKGIGKNFNEGVGELNGANKARKNDFIAEDNLKIEAQNKELLTRQEQEKNQNNDIAASNYANAVNNSKSIGRSTPDATDGATASVIKQPVAAAPAKNPTADFLGI